MSVRRLPRGDQRGRRARRASSICRVADDGAGLLAALDRAVEVAARRRREIRARGRATGTGALRPGRDPDGTPRSRRGPRRRARGSTPRRPCTRRRARRDVTPPAARTARTTSTAFHFSYFTYQGWSLPRKRSKASSLDFAYPARMSARARCGPPPDAVADVLPDRVEVDRVAVLDQLLRHPLAPRAPLVLAQRRAPRSGSRSSRPRTGRGCGCRPGCPTRPRSRPR